MGIHNHGRLKRRPNRSTPDQPALGLVESAWLFARGTQSVRIVRVAQRNAGPRLLVEGPDASHVVHDFDDMIACAIHQSELERRLVARSFRLQRFMPRAS